MKQIEDFLTQADTDMSVAMVATVKNKYCFVLQPSQRWGKTADCRDVLFFGGIGGKVKTGESLIAALQRETREEIGCNIEITATAQVCELPVITSQGIFFETAAASRQTPLPLCIFQNRRSEPGRKSLTNVFIYPAVIRESEKMRPLDNPAIILLPPEILYQTENGMDLSEAVARGAEIFSNCELPQNAVLKPTPTPLAMIQLHKWQQTKG